MTFERPEIEVVKFEQEDIITASYCDGAPTNLGDLYGNGCNFDPNMPDDDDDE